jgi:hypothetical protein
MSPVETRLLQLVAPGRVLREETHADVAVLDEDRSHQGGLANAEERDVVDGQRSPRARYGEGARGDRHRPGRAARRNAFDHVADVSGVTQARGETPRSDLASPVCLPW